MVLPGEAFRLTANAGGRLQAFVSVCSVAGLHPIATMPPFDDEPARARCLYR